MKPFSNTLLLLSSWWIDIPSIVHSWKPQPLEAKWPLFVKVFSFSPQNKALNSNQNKVHIWYHIDSILYYETLSSKFHDTIHLPNTSHTQKWFGERGLGHNRYRLSNFGSSQLLPHGEARIDRIDRCIYHHQPCPSNKETRSIQPSFSMAQGPWTCPIASQVVIFLMVSCLPNSLGPRLVWWSGGKLLRGSARLMRNFPRRLLTLEHGQHARHPLKSKYDSPGFQNHHYPSRSTPKICWQLGGLRGPWLNLMPNQLHNYCTPKTVSG